MTIKIVAPEHVPLGRVVIPGSKSYTNRALIMAACADGESVLHGVSLSNDSSIMIDALRKLGVGIDLDGDTAKVVGTGGSFKSFNGEIDVGPAGTTIRFLTALCASAEGVEVVMRGSERMHERPIGDLVDALRELGAEIEYLGDPGCPPLLIKGKRLNGGKVSMEGKMSSQFFSALLLASPLFASGLVVKVEGEQTSKSYIDMTFEGLEQFGITATNKKYKSYEVGADQSYKGIEYFVEGDASGAGYFWGLSAISGGDIKVCGVRTSSLQGDAKLPVLLAEMGCIVQEGVDQGVPWVTVTKGETLKGIKADLTQMPDSAQALAVVAACAEGNSDLSGLHTLRHKETDRIAAVAAELGKFSIGTDEKSEALGVIGGQIAWNGEAVETYEDHRMAMAFAMLSPLVPDLVIEEESVVNKSFPEFWNKFDDLGFSIECV